MVANGIAIEMEQIGNPEQSNAGAKGRVYGF